MYKNTKNGKKLGFFPFLLHKHWSEMKLARIFPFISFECTSDWKLQLIKWIFIEIRTFALKPNNNITREISLNLPLLTRWAEGALSVFEKRYSSTVWTSFFLFPLLSRKFLHNWRLNLWKIFLLLLKNWSLFPNRYLNRIEQARNDVADRSYVGRQEIHFRMPQNAKNCIKIESMLIYVGHGVYASINECEKEKRENNVEQKNQIHFSNLQKKSLIVLLWRLACSGG